MSGVDRQSGTPLTELTLPTVQAIRNITNFRAKSSYEFVRIRANFVLKFVKNSCTNLCLKITLLRKGYGKKYQHH